MSEIRRPGGGRERRSRGSEMDIQRAVMAARNPKDSKFGECLLNVNTKQDPVLKLRLGRISTEMRRMEFKMQQVKQHFMKTNPCVNHEPLILVERPASPQVKQRANIIQAYGADPLHLNMPGYMRPLQSQCKTPSTLTTIDVFTLKTRKKRNVWEEAMDDKEPPAFRSTVRPSAQLTRRERATLQLGWDAHKPRLDLDTNKAPETSPTPRPPPKQLAISATPFVTQLPRNKELPQTSDGHLAALKSVVLGEVSGGAGVGVGGTSSPPLPPLVRAGGDEKAHAASSKAQSHVVDARKGEKVAEKEGKGESDTEKKTESNVGAEKKEGERGGGGGLEKSDSFDDREQEGSESGSTRRRRRKVAIVKKPFFITERPG